MRAVFLICVIGLLSACATGPSPDTFNAMPQADRDAAIQNCVVEIGRTASADGSLNFDPPLTPQEGTAFANCIGRSA